MDNETNCWYSNKFKSLMLNSYYILCINCISLFVLLTCYHFCLNSSLISYGVMPLNVKTFNKSPPPLVRHDNFGVIKNISFMFEKRYDPPPTHTKKVKTKSNRKFPFLYLFVVISFWCNYFTLKWKLMRLSFS